MSERRLSLVIPCYNEEKNLPLLADRAKSLVSETGAQIVFVNNGSSDRTGQVLDVLSETEPNFKTVTVPVNQGYGYGICAGLNAANGDILGWTHADLQTDPMDAVKGLAFFNASDAPERVFVKGWRYGRPLADTVFTAGMSMFETALMGRVLRDVNAQPTLFHRRHFDQWDSPPEDFSLDLFALATAKHNGLSVHRFPVRFGERAHGQSSWNTDWSAKRRFIQRTLNYSFRLRARMNA